MTDEELMRRYRGGDVRAFETLYARHRGPLFRYVARLLHGGDTEAVYQETWLKVVRHRDRWLQEQPFKPWLYRIAHNAAIDALRARKPDAVDPEAGPDDCADSQPPLDQWQYIRDCVERLLQLLGALPAAQREAFLLKEEAGLSLQEIADVAEVGRETVKSRLRYALNRLRKGLEGCEHAA